MQHLEDLFDRLDLTHETAAQRFDELHPLPELQYQDRFGEDLTANAQGARPYYTEPLPRKLQRDSTRQIGYKGEEQYQPPIAHQVATFKGLAVPSPTPFGDTIQKLVRFDTESPPQQDPPKRAASKPSADVVRPSSPGPAPGPSVPRREAPPAQTSEHPPPVFGAAPLLAPSAPGSSEPAPFQVRILTHQYLMSIFLTCPFLCS